MDSQKEVRIKELNWKLWLNINYWYSQAKKIYGDTNYNEIMTNSIQTVLFLNPPQTILQNFKHCYLIEYKNNVIRLIFLSMNNEFRYYNYITSLKQYKSIQDYDYIKFNNLLITNSKPTFSYHDLKRLIELKKLEQKNYQLSQDNQELVSENHKQTLQLQQAYQQLKTQNDELEEKLYATKQDLKDNNWKLLKTNLEQLNRQKDFIIKDLKRTHEIELTDLKRFNSVLQSQLQQAQEQLTNDQDGCNQKIEQLQTQNNKLEQKNTKLIQQIEQENTVLIHKIEQLQKLNKNTYVNN